MTRSYISQPVWTWLCDNCARDSGDLAIAQSRLPAPDDMRARGWFIAELHGDLCPTCNPHTTEASA